MDPFKDLPRPLKIAIFDHISSLHRKSTDVWVNRAQGLVDGGMPMEDVFGDTAIAIAKDLAIAAHNNGVEVTVGYLLSQLAFLVIEQASDDS